MNSFKKLSLIMVSGFFAGFSSFAAAQNIEDFLGLWIVDDKEAIIQMRKCKRQSFLKEATSICGRLVWDNRAADCGRRIVQFDTLKDGVWSDGWALNVRDNRTYNAKLFMINQNKAMVRTFIGKETQSKEWYFERVSSYPNDCKGKRADKILIK